jgi:hypothetical protein
VPERQHRCDEECVCPIHGTPLFYWPHGDDHACQDIDCRYGHGMADELAAARARGDFLPGGAGWEERITESGRRYVRRQRGRLSEQGQILEPGNARDLLRLGDARLPGPELIAAYWPEDGERRKP